MSKKSKNKQSKLDGDTQTGGVNGQSKMGKKEYEAEILKLQLELVKLQEWVKATNAHVVIVFEGRDHEKRALYVHQVLVRINDLYA